jgi:hypothetical protein
MAARVPSHTIVNATFVAGVPRFDPRVKTCELCGKALFSATFRAFPAGERSVAFHGSHCELNGFPFVSPLLIITIPC